MIENLNVYITIDFYDRPCIIWTPFICSPIVFYWSISPSTIHINISHIAPCANNMTSCRNRRRPLLRYIIVWRTVTINIIFYYLFHRSCAYALYRIVYYIVCDKLYDNKKLEKKNPVIRIQHRRWNKHYYYNIYRHNYREWLRK